MEKQDRLMHRVSSSSPVSSYPHPFVITFHISSGTRPKTQETIAQRQIWRRCSRACCNRPIHRSMRYTHWLSRHPSTGTKILPVTALSEHTVQIYACGGHDKQTTQRRSAWGGLSLSSRGISGTKCLWRNVTHRGMEESNLSASKHDHSLEWIHSTRWIRLHI